MFDVANPEANGHGAPRLRPFGAPDLGSLSAILAANAPESYDDPSLIGHIYSAPYAVLTPAAVFVAEDASGVGGYVVGARETREFEARLARDWWPSLQRHHPNPSGDPLNWTPDERRRHAFHAPRRVPDVVVDRYPSHVHLQLLPRLQGRGIGPALLRLWLARAQPVCDSGLHVGVNPANGRALGFWQAQGFKRIGVADHAGVVWLGLGRRS